MWCRSGIYAPGRGNDRRGVYYYLESLIAYTHPIVCLEHLRGGDALAVDPGAISALFVPYEELPILDPQCGVGARNLIAR